MSVASSAAGAGLPSAKGTPSVLVVEDDPSLATQLVRGLSRGGYRVDHVMTGRDALASGLAAGDAVALTVEPAGGTSHPTTRPIVVMAL